ncbi:hypothetical protein HMI54_015645, partial [Coelomomyces lativittatus]
MTYFVSTFLIVVSCLASMVNAHGHLTHPGVFTALADQRGNQNGVNACGLVSNAAITDAIKRFPPTFIQPGTEAKFLYTVTNGDGAGPVRVDIDTTGAGTTFNTPATITTQVPGNNANLAQNQAPGGRFPGDFPLSFTVPQGLNCPSGACVLKVTNPQNFISCMFITTDPRFATTIPSMFPSDQQLFLGNAIRVQQQVGGQGAIGVQGIAGGQQGLIGGQQGLIGGQQGLIGGQQGLIGGQQGLIGGQQGLIGGQQ